MHNQRVLFLFLQQYRPISTLAYRLSTMSLNYIGLEICIGLGLLYSGPNIFLVPQPVVGVFVEERRLRSLGPTLCPRRP